MAFRGYDRGKKVISLIKRNGEYLYYMAPEDVWVLDRQAWRGLFVKHGVDVPELSQSERFGMPLVNQDNALMFIGAITPYKISAQDLVGELRKTYPAEDWFDVSHLFPKVLIDFDATRLVSVEVDGIPYEKFVPDKWTGTLEDFYSEIPLEYRYWIDGRVDYLQSFGT